MFEISLSLVSLFVNNLIKGKNLKAPTQIKKTIMARYGAESATFGGVVLRGPKFEGKIQNGPSGLIWPRCKGQFSPKFWY